MNISYRLCVISGSGAVWVKLFLLHELVTKMISEFQLQVSIRLSSLKTLGDIVVVAVVVKMFVQKRWNILSYIGL